MRVKIQERDQSFIYNDSNKNSESVLSRSQFYIKLTSNFTREAFSSSNLTIYIYTHFNVFSRLLLYI